MVSSLETQLHPVEGLVARQGIENGAGALADQHLQIGQALGRHGRIGRLALGVVPGRIHGDEHRRGEGVFLIADDDVAIGGKDPVVAVHRHDVVELGDRPVGAKGAVGAVVHRIVAPQAAEHFMMSAGGEQIGPAGVDPIQRHGPRIPRSLGAGRDSVHGNLPDCCSS